MQIELFRDSSEVDDEPFLGGNDFRREFVINGPSPLLNDILRADTRFVTSNSTVAGGIQKFSNAYVGIVERKVLKDNKIRCFAWRAAATEGGL